MKRKVILAILAVGISTTAYVVYSGKKSGKGDPLTAALKQLSELEGKKAAYERYNSIINDQVNEGHYEAGAQALAELLEEAPADIRERIRRDMALCYRALGDDPAAPMKDAAQWYAKARELHPESLTDSQLEVLRAAGL